VQCTEYESLELYLSSNIQIPNNSSMSGSKATGYCQINSPMIYDNRGISLQSHDKVQAVVNTDGNGADHWKQKARTAVRTTQKIGAFNDADQASDQLKSFQSNRETGSPAKLVFLWERKALPYLDPRERHGSKIRRLTLIKSNIPAQRLKFGHWRQPRWCMTVR